VPQSTKLEMNNKHSIPAPMGYRIEKFQGAEEGDLLNRIGKLRFQVWKQKKTRILREFPNEEWLDEEEDSSTHWGAFHGDRLIGACRMTIYKSIHDVPDESYHQLLESAPAPLNYLTRDVVTSEHQGNGIGHYFNLVRIAESEKTRVKTLFASIPDYRIRSFENLGFEVIRPPKLGIIFPDMKWAIVAKFI
jgi:hypothetical protein